VRHTFPLWLLPHLCWPVLITFLLFNTGCHREKGWDKPHIKPYQNLSLDPASSVFHYALEVRVLHESCVVGADRVCNDDNNNTYTINSRSMH
jgi:hypothetical protein